MFAQEWHHERGCCSLKCLLAWERYRVTQVCRQYPLMDEIIDQRDLARALDILATHLNCRPSIDRSLGWLVTVNATWVSPDWAGFVSHAVDLFGTIEGFAADGGEIVGPRCAQFAALKEDLFDALLALIADVTRWRRSCIRDCDAWTLEHASEIVVRADSAFALHNLSFDAVRDLHEWIELIKCADKPRP